MSLYPELTHILRLTKHHLKQYQIQNITMEENILVAEFIRRSLQNEGSVPLYKVIFHFQF